MSYKIVVMSCDKNKDLWKPFYLCMEKYWKNHPEIIYSTETLENPYYKTICKDIPIDKWTKRVYETVKDLDCSHILLMVDDLFIREKVNYQIIDHLATYITNNVASINFEFSFDKKDILIYNRFGIMLRNPNGKFKLSCMCQLWKKSALLDLFNVEYNPWGFEKKGNPKHYSFLISKNGNFINWGKRHDTWKWGIVKGKWTKECKEFFDKEGIKDIDYSIRGFINEN